MYAIVDAIMEAWDRLVRLMGFDRLRRTNREVDLEGRGRWARAFYWIRPLIALLVLVYLGTLIWRFSWIRGEDLAYPQAVIDPNAVTAGAEDGSGGCGRSQLVDMDAYLIDFLVDQNDWEPATPQYKIGFFGLLDFAATPFFDNKASFQMGVLRGVRRMSIELADLLGRQRGTSGEDPDLRSARSLLQTDEELWLINPLAPGRQLVATPSGRNYANARERLLAYNGRLAKCDALWDARADNLGEVLDRVAKETGSTIDQLASRSAGVEYDPKTKRFVAGQGNDAGWFDMQADNLFHRARGEMYAYHGLLQALRYDFSEVVQTRQLAEVWDRMEKHVAEAALLDPIVVSNGREDGAFAPDHLSVMAENMLRARANMVELREILTR